MGASGQAEARGPIPGGDASGGHSKAPYYREVGENEHEEDPRKERNLAPKAASCLDWGAAVNNSEGGASTPTPGGRKYLDTSMGLSHTHLVQHLPCFSHQASGVPRHVQTGRNETEACVVPGRCGKIEGNQGRLPLGGAI